MPSRCATKHGQIRLRKGRRSEACLGKSQTTEEPTVKWCAVEVCGFGVPLPRSNLLAARVSKSCCNRPNVGCLDLLCKRFMNIFKRAVTIPSTEHDFLWQHAAARPREAKTPAVKQSWHNERWISPRALPPHTVANKRGAPTAHLHLHHSCAAHRQGHSPNPGALLRSRCLRRRQAQQPPRNV